MQEQLQRGALVALLEQHRPPNTAVWALHPPQRNLSPKVRQLVDFLRLRLGELAEYRSAC
ncbi:LysR substrate binding domain protein [compost metagenome]